MNMIEVFYRKPNAKHLLAGILCASSLWFSFHSHLLTWFMVSAIPFILISCIKITKWRNCNERQRNGQHGQFIRACACDSLAKLLQYFPFFSFALAQLPCHSHYTTTYLPWSRHTFHFLWSSWSKISGRLKNQFQFKLLFFFVHQQ